MKKPLNLKTLPRAIRREKPITLPRDVAEWLDEIDAELRREYVLSHEDMLRGLDRSLLGLTLCGDMAVLMYADRAIGIDISGMDRREISGELISRVMAEAMGVGE